MARDGWWMEKCGSKNTYEKMQMKNADEKITDEKITNDNMRMMKSL